MNTREKATTLVAYVRSLDDFQIKQVEEPYNHMGATITDAILQAGVRYDTVVRPRVHKLIKQYPEGKTTSGFLQLLDKVGSNALLDWSDNEKPNRVLGVTQFFAQQGIEIESDLKIYLQTPAHVGTLKALRGLGDKTIDYFKILVGVPTAAIDRQLNNFLARAGAEANTYDEAQAVIHAAADLLQVNRADLDHSIWRYMSTRGDGQSVSHSTNTRSMARSHPTDIASFDHKEALYYRFWQQLLDKARSHTNLHARTSPSKVHWIGATSRGFGFNYAIRSSDAYVELWINQGNSAVNKRTFDRLTAQKQAIEKTFGNSLFWRRMNERRACSIQYVLPDSGFDDQTRWPRNQERMIDAMVRLDNAFRPYIS
jgi:hypothetical protein